MKHSLRGIDLASLQDYSQNGEQAIIGRFLQENELAGKEFFVDVGAYDGLTGSNTRFLAELGWSGILIEPNPDVFDRLSALYASNPSARCIRCAISDRGGETGEMEMMIADGPENTSENERWMFSQVSTLNPCFAEVYIEQHGYRYRSIQVAARPLTEVLSANGCPPDLALLCIDCEGEDHRIIQGFDFSRFRPRLLCVESDDHNRSVFADLLTPHGYKVYDFSASNAFFALG